MTIFKGSGVALITPMKEDGSVDYEQLKELAEWHVQEGSDAIIACGTTGEASTLVDEEHLAVIDTVVKQVNGRIPVIAGTGSNDTKPGIFLSVEAEKCLVRIERETLRNDGTRCARRCDGRTERGHYHIEYREECKRRK